MSAGAATRLPDDVLADIQGFITSGYGHLSYAAYLFVRFQEAAAARRWRVRHHLFRVQSPRDEPGLPIVIVRFGRVDEVLRPGEGPVFIGEGCEIGPPTETTQAALVDASSIGWVNRTESAAA